MSNQSTSKPKEPGDIYEQITEISIQNPRYSREAYLFVLRGLEWSMRQLGQRRHLTGAELTELLTAFARDQFGGMAWFVLQEWGIFETRDFGEIVYRLIEEDLMGKEPDDQIDDFNGVLDLKEALSAPEFVPGPLQSSG